MPRPTTQRSHDDGVDRWHVTSAAPMPALAGWVSGYSDYDEVTGSFAARRELAATKGVLIFNLGGPLEIVDASGRTLRLGAGEGFAGGLADGTSISRTEGQQTGVHVFAPVETIGRLLGCPVGEVANRTVRLDEAIGRAARETGARLAEANSAERRFAILDAFVAERLARAPEADRSLAASAAWLRQRPDLPIASLAARIDVDRRSFARRFRAAYGVSPRRFGRIARFERFAALIAAQPDQPLGELAVAAGYYDQPHLNRDVRELAAMTPAELRASLVPEGWGVRDA